MSNIKQYIDELRQQRTLTEIAGLASVSKNTLKNYINGKTIHAGAKNFNRILSLWCREVYCNE